MKDKLATIRLLLDDIEHESEAPSDEKARVSGLELPDVIRDVIDLLLPETKPYEAALYMYMLRHSVVENGSQLVRISRRRLARGVIKSPYSDRPSRGEAGTEESSGASYRSIQGALEGLIAIGAIRQESEPNREGTLFRVLLPEEIEVCNRARRDRMAAAQRPAVDELNELDFYNVRANRTKVYERDNYHCKYCNKQLTRLTATLDHVHPVAAGGDNSFSNLVTACLDCNARKNKRPVGDFLAERGS